MQLYRRLLKFSSITMLILQNLSIVVNIFVNYISVIVKSLILHICLNVAEHLSNSL